MSEQVWVERKNFYSWQKALQTCKLKPATTDNLKITIFNNMEKACLECGEKIVGRTDKKFCSDYCRNAYNNNLNKDSKNMVRNVNNQLRKNYRILEELNPDGKIKLPKSKLTAKGFSFDYFTSIYTTKTGNTYYFVYDQGYLPLDGDFYALVKRI